MYDPAEDKLISAAYVQWGWWGGSDEHVMMLAGGYAAGTPLTAVHAGLLRSAGRAAALAGSPAKNVGELVAKEGLPSVERAEAVQVGRIESFVHAVEACCSESCRSHPAAPPLQSWCSRERPVVLDLGAHLGKGQGTMSCARLGGSPW